MALRSSIGNTTRFTTSQLLPVSLLGADVADRGWEDCAAYFAVEVFGEVFAAISSHTIPNEECLACFLAMMGDLRWSRYEQCAESNCSAHSVALDELITFEVHP